MLLILWKIFKLFKVSVNLSLLSSSSRTVHVCMCVFVSERQIVCVLMVIVFALLAFRPHFIADRGKSVTQFLFLHHYNEQHCRRMRVCKQEKTSSMTVCMCCIMVYQWWMWNEKPGASIWWSLYLNHSMNRLLSTADILSILILHYNILLDSLH